jgi:hypothetical protein
MQTENLISINEFCIHHNIEISFVNSLHQKGLIEITTIDESFFIDAVYLPQLEKIVYFYYELDINLEGIETINHLLKRIELIQGENTRLRNRLRLYETNE